MYLRDIVLYSIVMLVIIGSLTFAAQVWLTKKELKCKTSVYWKTKTINTFHLNVLAAFQLQAKALLLPGVGSTSWSIHRAMIYQSVNTLGKGQWPEAFQSEIGSLIDIA